MLLSTVVGLGDDVKGTSFGAFAEDAYSWFNYILINSGL